MEANIINDCEEVRDYRNRYRQYNWKGTLRYFFILAESYLLTPEMCHEKFQYWL